MAISLLVSSALLASIQAQAAPQTGGEEPQAVEATAEDDALLGDANDEPAVAEAATDEDKVICRRTRITGSRFNKKLCGTKAQWEAMSRRGKNATEELRNRGRSIAQPGS
ncbi:hypothetical protein [Erythrobacter rubeus]|uniref:Uncharacterized protein n=1 Tax=Erythrobacter rubeus TaxID=2760803 RepID=A0ABR8KKE1_9SPHN|nr:hypothetical protein [Erythrobacter rubeus]MBD2840726.1 hypothetical protein [Erythrobacter rubeus]